MPLMPVPEALARVLAGANPLPAEFSPLAQAHGRVLAQDIAALRTQPPADVSAMDGYAVRAADVASVPARLRLIGEIAAGHPFQGSVGPGEAARIFTGGVLPPGTDTIVIQENTTREARHGGGHDRRWHGQACARQRARFSARRSAAGQGPPSHRSRPRARRRDEPPETAGASPAQAGRARHRRRAGDAGLHTRIRRDRLFERLCHHGAGAPGRLRGGRSRHRA